MLVCCGDRDCGLEGIHGLLPVGGVLAIEGKKLQTELKGFALILAHTDNLPQQGYRLVKSRPFEVYFQLKDGMDLKGDALVGACSEEKSRLRKVFERKIEGERSPNRFGLNKTRMLRYQSGGTDFCIT